MMKLKMMKLAISLTPGECADYRKIRTNIREKKRPPDKLVAKVCVVSEPSFHPRLANTQHSWSETACNKGHKARGREDKTDCEVDRAQ